MTSARCTTATNRFGLLARVRIVVIHDCLFEFNGQRPLMASMVPIWACVFPTARFRVGNRNRVFREYAHTLHSPVGNSSKMSCRCLHDAGAKRALRSMNVTPMMLGRCLWRPCRRQWSVSRTAPVEGRRPPFSGNRFTTEAPSTSDLSVLNRELRRRSIRGNAARHAVKRLLRV